MGTHVPKLACDIQSVTSLAAFHHLFMFLHLSRTILVKAEPLLSLDSHIDRFLVTSYNNRHFLAGPQS